MRVAHHDSRAMTRPGHGSSVIRAALLLSGLLSSLLYVAIDVMSALRYPGYSFADQAISELSAIGAPTSGFWSAMMWAYTAFVGAFAFGVLRAANRNRALRVTGSLLLAFGASGILWRFFPMHQRGTEMTWQDVGHIVLGVGTVLLMLAWTGFGAFALGRRFRAYSFATMAALLVAGAVSFTYTGQIAAGGPTPGLGIVERINIYGYLLWIAVLSVALVRHRR